MKNCFIIRGPAGVGKSTVAKLLAKKTNAFLVSYDDVLEKNDLDHIEGESIPLRNYLRANELVLPEILQNLQASRFVILDGCFYHKEQHADLERKLKIKIPVVTLTSTVDEAIHRNKERGSQMPEQAIRDVYRLVQNTPLGRELDTQGCTAEETASAVMKLLDA